METISAVTDKLKTISEQNVEYIDVMKRPDLIHGLVSSISEMVDFSRVTYKTRTEIGSFGKNAENEMNNLYRNAAGTQLIFRTSASRFIIKAELKRAYGYRKMTMWNSSGFDVYETKNGQYRHRTVFAPPEGSKCFAESLSVTPGTEICIYLPNYNCISSLQLGCDKNHSFSPCLRDKLPVVFYGNSVTQGASASRSGNSFVNIVSRKTNRDVINLSVSSCCRGQIDMARAIGTTNCCAIIVDYTRNAWSTSVFRESYMPFYTELRKRHPDTKIVLMTSSCFNHWREYDDFDEIVREVYRAALQNGERTVMLDQRALFSEEEYDFVTIDGSHFTDYGMYKIASAICELI